MLGEKIWRLREAQGLSQEELAEKLGVSRQTVSNWENDRATPDAYKLKQLCETLGTSADALLGMGEETPQEGKPPRKEGRPKIWAAVLFVVLAAVFAVLAIVLFAMPYESGEAVSSAITLTPRLGGVLFTALAAILLIPAAVLFFRRK